MCTAVEGDWDAYLREMGASWALRTTAAGLGFGAGRQTQEIVQTADQMEVCNVVQSITPKRTMTVYRTDGREELVPDLEGHLTKCTTRWDGPVLVTVTEPCHGAGGVALAVRRFMREDCMCTERVTESGLVVRRLYARRR